MSHAPRTLVIAEVGVNHNGSLAVAKQMVEACAKAGADVVKFQTFKADSLTTNNVAMADYQAQNLGSQKSQQEMLRSLELSMKDFAELKALCGDLGVEFLSTAFDIESLRDLMELGLHRIKIPSGEMTNLPYLRECARLNPGQILLSTGMATLDEIHASLKALYKASVQPEQMVVLHCSSDYPLSLNDVNLRVLDTYQREFGTAVGYSDHTIDLDVPSFAVANGAVVIEKHVTLSRQMPGPDHLASLEMAEFAEMVRRIRKAEVVAGRAEKLPSSAELKTKDLVRKKIVAKLAIAAGEILTEKNLTTMRSQKGESAMLWDQVIGRKVKSAHQPMDPILLDGLLP